MKVWITLVAALAIVETRALGFAVERSKSAASAHAIWPETVFDGDRRASIKLLLNGKIYTPDLDNILLDSETKKSANEEIVSCSSSSEESQRLKRSENIKFNETRLESNGTDVSELKESTIKSLSSPEAETSVVTAEKTSDNKSPRNVVLLLIDDAGIARETMWKNFETSHKFNVQGFLQNCRVAGIGDTDKASSGAPLASGGINAECECERFLRANVETLFSWSRHVKEMNTATISTTNFSISSFLGSDRPTIQLKDLDDNEEPNGMRQEIPPSRSSIGNSWRMMYPDKQLISAEPSAFVLSPAKQDGYDGMWDVFDMFSRIRIAFFRILLESLGNLSGSDDEFGTRRAFPLQPSIVELITDSIKDLEAVSNDKGFMMIAAAQGNELSAAIDVLRRELSVKNTLIVVAGMCSKINETVPFFAEGPGDKTLREVRTIWDLPAAIRAAISNGCPGKICGNERRTKPAALPSLELLSLPQDFPRRRVARAKDEDEKSDTTTSEKSTKEIAEDVEENKSTPKPGKRSENGAEKMRIDGVTAILGIVTSATAALALNS